MTAPLNPPARTRRSSSCGGLVRRHRSAARQSRRSALGFFFIAVGERIVGVARKRDRVGGVQLLGARRGQRQHLHVDAGGVHGGDALVADIAKRLEQLERAAFEFQRRVFEVLAGTVEKQRRGEMFFKSDDLHDDAFLMDYRSTVMWASWISLRHFGSSVRMRSLQLLGRAGDRFEILRIEESSSAPAGSAKIFAHLAVDLGDHVGRHAAPGRTGANHETARKPGTVSAIAGTSGNSAMRFGAPTAIDFTAPALACGIALPATDEHQSECGRR